MIRLFAILGLTLTLAGCGLMGFGDDDKPALTVPNVPRERSVDPSRAAQLINAHRKSRGRSALVVDPELNKIAAETARELARRDKLMTRMHTSGGLARRLAAANYSAGRAAENLGSGYPTLVMAVEGWERSPGHNKNLLNPEMTHMGIGLALTDKGKFHSYWVLLLAKPD